MTKEQNRTPYFHNSFTDSMQKYVDKFLEIADETQLNNIKKSMGKFAAVLTLVT